MKKFVWLLALLFVVGCTNDGGNENNGTDIDTTESQVESEPTEVSDTAIESLPDETSESDVSSETPVASNPGKKVALDVYVPTALQRDTGTEIYDEIITVAEDFVVYNAELGDEELFTLSYTGYHIENENGKLQAFFMGINRVNQPLADLTFTLNFIVGETPVWENMEFTLAEGEFGTQPVNTAMPIFLDVPAGNEELLKNATPEESYIEIYDLEVP